MNFRYRGYHIFRRFSLLIALWAFSYSIPSLAQFQSYTASLSASHNSNVGFTRSKDLDEYLITANISGQSYFEGAPGSGVFINSSLSATAYKEYPDLNRVDASIQLGYTKKLGIGFNQPRISASLNLAYRHSESQIRGGWSIAPQLAYSKNISNRLTISTNLQHFIFTASDRIAVPDPNSPNSVDGDSKPASIQNTQLNIASEWAWTPRTYLGLDISYLSGQFHSTALPNPEIASFSNAVSVDDGFGPGYYLYRYNGKGSVLGAELIRTLSNNREVIFRLQRSLVDADNGVGYGQTIANFSFSKSF